MRSLFLRLGGPVAVAALAAVLLLLRPGAEPAALAQPAGTPADLALVPADAAGFVHLRLADLWKNEMFAEFRKTFEKAGPKALAALDAQFVPAPSTLDRATGFVVLDPQKGPLPFAVLAFSAPFDRAKVVQAYGLGEAKKQAGGKAVYASQALGAEVYFPDDRHVMIGMPDSFATYFAKPPAKDGPIAGAIKLAASGKPMVAAANVSAMPIPKQVLDQLPPEVKPLLKTQMLLLSADLGAQARVDVKATYPDAAAAADARKAVRALAEMGRKELAKLKADMERKLYDPNVKTPRRPDDLPAAVFSVFALGALARADEILADESLVKQSGAELAVSVSLPKELTVLVGGGGAVMVGLLLPAVQKVREAAARTKSQNNLKQIGLAIHNYHDVYRKFPEDIKDKTGKPIMSWRVAILPFIEQQALYNQFKQDEPWDGPNNKKLSQMVVPTYLSPADEPVAVAADGYGMTNYLGVAGPGTMFDPKGKLTFADVTDGLSNTIMVVETLDQVPWAKPGDLAYDPAKPLPKITPAWPGGSTNVLMGDGSVRALNVKTVPEKTLRALFTRNGGEVIGPNDW
jgi:prepilin-type processing-associated H-X9-DG protein